jgi:uncharacterized membrane protein YecN with MAPEG domain
MRIFTSSIYIGLAALLLVILSLRIIQLRYRYKAEIGDGGVPELQRAIRAQANFIEYVPIALLLILMADLVGHQKWVVHVLGILLLIGRLAHAYGFTTSPGISLGRTVGVGLTTIVLVVGAALAIAAFFGVRIGPV